MNINNIPKYKIPPSVTQHFNDRLLERYGLTNDEIEGEIISKIKSGAYKRVMKTEKAGVYKYKLYTYGSRLKLIFPDTIVVAYDWKNNQLITIA